MESSSEGVTEVKHGRATNAAADEGNRVKDTNKKKKKPTGENKRRKKSTGDDGGAGSEKGQNEVLSDADIKSRTEHDAEMQKVCLHLGRVPDCLLTLSVERAWSDNIGNQVYSVPLLHQVLPH